MEMEKEMLKLNLQLFADGEDDNNPDVKTDPEETPGDSKDEEKKYTDKDVDDIINKKFAKWQADRDAEVENAKKLAKMNADEKKEFELQQAKERIAEFERKEAFNETIKEVSRMLSDESITLSEEVVAMFVKDDAETTQTAVNTFIKDYQAAVEAGIKKALTGNAPKKYFGAGTALTKEQIMSEKDASKRIQMIQDNPHLF
ncbi:DUF4355 domain-containing protein [Globicatella sulfidifaciens]